MPMRPLRSPAACVHATQGRSDQPTISGFQSNHCHAGIRDDEATFREVAVDRQFGTILWPGDIDLDPDVLRGISNLRPDESCRDESSSRPEHPVAEGPPPLRAARSSTPAGAGADCGGGRQSPPGLDRGARRN